MLPRPRLVIAALAAVFVAAAALSLLSASRSVSLCAVGPRSATGSPIEYSLPEPPNWKQSVALAASRRAEELNRLLDLVGTVPESTTTPAQPSPPEAVDAPAPRPAPRQNSDTASDTAPAASPPIGE